MGFSDEARKLAQQEQQARDEQDPYRQFIDITKKALRIQERDERWRSDCREKVEQWFEGVGMSPHPPYSIGEIRRRPTSYSDSSEFCIEITWEFDGYKYMAACPENPKSRLTVEMNIKGFWIPAGNTKEAIGRALLREEWRDPRSAWASAAMKPYGPEPQKDIPPPPKEPLI
jgi:hypothetical protein